jgi:hypothetical protein
MTVNNIRLRLNNQDRSLEVPIIQNWDINGINESIELFERDIIKKTINPIDDFETVRYGHEPWSDSITNITQTSTNYEFYFYNAVTDTSITATTNDTNWVLDYRANGLSTANVLYREPVFTKSFFKLDFYDTKNSSNQQIYLTMIIPVRQGKTMNVPFGVNNTVDIKIPSFSLDYVGDKEAYYIYWLKSAEFVNLTHLYMSAKFYDAGVGQFKRMITNCQGFFQNKFNFPKEDYFYYRVNLNYNTYKYEVYYEDRVNGLSRVGTSLAPIKWFEYVNP